MSQASHQSHELRNLTGSVIAALDRGRGLPNLVYRSNAVFEFERANVLGRSWAAIGFASEVSGPGYAVPVDFMGTPLLMVRDHDNELRVFHNVCSHRGMLLVPDAQKNRSLIRCPYHSWSYKFDGTLAATPHVGGMNKNDCDGFERTDHGLKIVRFAIWMDIVFVNLSGDAESFAAFIAPLEKRWERFLKQQQRSDIRPASSGSTLQLTIDCNWKLAVENYCESYHLPWVHPDLNSYSPLDQHFNITDGDSMSGQGTHIYQLAESRGTTLPTFTGWPDEKIKHAEYISLYPNTLLGLQADHFFAVVVLPKSAPQTIEKLQISFVGDAADKDRFSTCREAVLNSWEKVFREDIFAVEGMQSGRASPGFDGGVLTPVQDIPTRHFHSWVGRQYSQSGPRSSRPD